MTIIIQSYMIIWKTFVAMRLLASLFSLKKNTCEYWKNFRAQ